MAEYDEDTLCEAAANALPAWGLSATRVSLVSHSENIVFRAETQSGVYALRFHRPGYHSLDALNSEIMWHDMIRAAGLETPIAVKTLDNAYYTQVDMPELGQRRYVGLTQWLDGTVLRALIDQSNDATVRRGYYRQVGALMATLHTHASQWTPPPGFVRHAFDTDGLTGPNPFWGRFWESKAASPSQRLELEAARDQLRGVLSSMDKGPDWFGLIHADLHPENIMVDGERVIIFDFDDAGFGWFLYDIATAVFDAWLDDDDYLGTYEGLIEGYSDIRPFTDEMRALAPYFLLARLLAYIGWFNDRPENRYYSSLPELIARACVYAKELRR